jgi:hypothetical protein
MVEIFVWVIAFIVGILSAGRLTRLVVHDSFPPSVKFRMWWDDKTDGSLWNPLFNCHWCLSFWITLPIGLWAWLSNLHTSWWVFNAIMAASYVVPMVIERDQKD